MRHALAAVLILAATALPIAGAGCFAHAAGQCTPPIFDVESCEGGDTVDVSVQETTSDGCDVVDVGVRGREQDGGDVVDLNVAGEERDDGGDRVDVSVAAQEFGDSGDQLDVTVGGFEERDTGDGAWIEILPQVGCAVGAGSGDVEFCSPGGLSGSGTRPKGYPLPDPLQAREPPCVSAFSSSCSLP